MWKYDPSRYNAQENGYAEPLGRGHIRSSEYYSLVRIHLARAMQPPVRWYDGVRTLGWLHCPFDEVPLQDLVEKAMQPPERADAVVLTFGWLHSPCM